MARPLLRLLAYYPIHGKTIGAGATYSPAPSSTTSPALPLGLLNGKQVAEVKYIELWSPVNNDGSDQDLRYVQLVLDGVPYEYIWLDGHQSSSMCPPRKQIVRGKPLDFGKSFVDEKGNPRGLLDATCPKYTKSVTVNLIAGTSAVTADMAVAIWGYVYDSVQLAKDIPTYAPPAVTINDGAGMSFTIPAPKVASGGDWMSQWTALGGGKAQAKSSSIPVFMFIRKAKNSNASDVNKAYVPQWANSSNSPAVQSSQDNLYFNLTAQQGLLYRRYGLNGPAFPNATGYDVLSSWIETPARGTATHNPVGGTPAGYVVGDTRFGLIPGTTNQFQGIPFVPTELLSTDERSYPTWVDNGKSIPALDVEQAIVATLFGTADALD